VAAASISSSSRSVDAFASTPTSGCEKRQPQSLGGRRGSGAHDRSVVFLTPVNRTMPRNVEAGSVSEVPTDPADLDWREKQAVDRRRATETAMWTIPSASLAAQAFLYTRGLDPNTSGLARLLVAVVGAVTAVATIKILGEQSYRADVFRLYLHARRRDREVEGMRRRDLANEVERLGDPEAAELKHYDAGWRRLLREGPGAGTTWLVVMTVFLVVDLFTFIVAVFELAGAWSPFA
jgi:hypothetical protein